MKHIILLSGLFFISFNTKAQGKKPSIYKGFFKEFAVSFNQTQFSDHGGGYTYEGISNGKGFGIGAYHTYRSKKHVNLRFGMEFNRIRYFAKSQYRGHYCTGSDFSFARNFISMPLGFRINIGSKTKVFIEAGGSFELGIGGYGRGTQTCLLPFQPVKTNQLNGEGHNFHILGIYGGAGFRIPVSKYELIAKTDLKVLMEDSFFYPYYRLSLGFKFN